MNPRSILLVAVGGMIGTALRVGVSALLPDAGGLPLGTLAVNVAGSFLIGIVAARLPKRGASRLFFGTGLLGGFTTYSAFALGIQQLATQSATLAVGYAVLSLVFGMAAVALGLRLATPKART